MKALRSESYKRGIVISTLLNIVNKGLVFVNSLLIAFYFGTQLKVDIYFYAYNTIFLLVAFVSSLTTSVLIPESMRIRAQKGRLAAMSFLNFFLYGYFLLTALISLAFLIDPVAVFTTLSNYAPSVLQQQTTILRLAIPLLILVSITTLLTEILASLKFFTAPMLVNIINAISSLLFLLVFHKVWDVKSILAGLLISYSVNIILLAYLLKSFLRWRFSFRFIKMEKRLLWNMLYAQMGNFGSVLGGYAPLYFLSGFGAGLISSLNYAQQVVTQPATFITNQFAAVAKIKVTELYVSGKFSEVNVTVVRVVNFLVFILVPVSGLLFLFADEVIAILFKRGSFDVHSAQSSGLFLRYLGLSIPLTAIISVVSNLYFAAQLVKASIIYQIISNLLLATLVYAGLKWLGAVGYPFAYLAINALNVLVAWFYCMRFFPFVKYQLILKYFAVTIVLNFGLVMIVKFLVALLPPTSSFIRVFTGSGLYLALLLLANYFFTLNEDFSAILANTKKKVMGSVFALKFGA